MTNPGLRTLKPRNILVARLRGVPRFTRGAASGWDYSSRWLRDTGRLAGIRTTQFIPIDLNAFLLKLESAIANISALKGEKETEALFRQKGQCPSRCGKPLPLG